MKLVVVRRNIFLTVTQTSIHRYIANTMFFYLELNIEKKERKRKEKHGGSDKTHTKPFQNSYI